MAKLDLLRKIIREEVSAVFQQELASILKESILNRGSNTIVETKQPTQPRIPGTLNTAPAKRVIPPNLGAGNPLNALLAETAMSMTTDDYESMGGISSEREAPIVESVNDMFAAARPSSNLDAIQINAVPDFTGIMARMKEKGEI